MKTVKESRKAEGLQLDKKTENKARNMRKSDGHLQHPQINDRSERAKNAKIGC